MRNWYTIAVACAAIIVGAGLVFWLTRPNEAPELSVRQQTNVPGRAQGMKQMTSSKPTVAVPRPQRDAERLKSQAEQERGPQQEAVVRDPVKHQPHPEPRKQDERRHQGYHPTLEVVNPKKIDISSEDLDRMLESYVERFADHPQFRPNVGDTFTVSAYIGTSSNVELVAGSPHYRFRAKYQRDATGWQLRSAYASKP